MIHSPHEPNFILYKITQSRSWKVRQIIFYPSSKLGKGIQIREIFKSVNPTLKHLFQVKYAISVLSFEVATFLDNVSAGPEYV